MARLAMPGLPEGAARPLGEQPGRLQGAVLEHGQPVSARRQPHAAQGALHGAGGHAQLPAMPQIRRDATRAPGRRADGHARQQPLRLRRQLHGPAGARPVPPRTHAILAVTLQPPARGGCDHRRTGSRSS